MNHVFAQHTLRSMPTMESTRVMIDSLMPIYIGQGFWVGYDSDEESSPFLQHPAHTLSVRQRSTKTSHHPKQWNMLHVNHIGLVGCVENANPTVPHTTTRPVISATHKSSVLVVSSSIFFQRFSQLLSCFLLWHSSISGLLLGLPVILCFLLRK